MSLSDLAALGSFVSGMAVLVSLVFLYFQMRQVKVQVEQNSRHTRALIQQGRTDRVTSNVLAMATPDLAAAFVEGNGDVATPDKIRNRQFGLICHAIIRSWEDGFAQHQDGLLSHDQFMSNRAAIANSIAQPGFHRYWLEWKGRTPDCNASFKDYVDGIKANSGPSSVMW